MKFASLAVCSLAIPVFLSAGVIDMGTSGDTVSFNNTPNPEQLTLGANSCAMGQSICTYTGGGSSNGVNFDWQFTMPNLSASPFTYLGPDSVINTNGSPTLTFTLDDTAGDSASGTFLLNGLSPDSGSGIDIDGSVTFANYNSGNSPTAFAAFENLFGLPSSSPLDFVLDVGSCTRETRDSGPVSTTCIPNLVVNNSNPDPTAQFISLSLTTNPSAVPEPGTFAMIGLASIGIFGLRRRSSKS